VPGQALVVQTLGRLGVRDVPPAAHAGLRRGVDRRRGNFRRYRSKAGQAH
jgi:hypothetical protein